MVLPDFARFSESKMANGRQVFGVPMAPVALRMGKLAVSALAVSRGYQVLKFKLQKDFNYNAVTSASPSAYSGIH